jgi:hypothetical protein
MFYGNKVYVGFVRQKKARSVVVGILILRLAKIAMLIIMHITLTKQTVLPPPSQFNVVNNAETRFGNLP